MNAPDIRTPLPGPRAKAIIDRDRKFVSPSYTRDYPFVIARGEGAVVEDVDGNRFIDCAAGIAVNSTGVSHPDVVAAITEQAGKFILRQVREHFHYSISDYLRSLIRHDEFRREVGPTSKKRPEPISLKEFMEMDDEQ